MVLEEKKQKENNMNKINYYFKKNLVGKIAKNYKYRIKKKYLVNIKYYYWLYYKIYKRDNIGLCIKKVNKIFINMESFILYFKYKDLKLNQLYFNNSPYNYLLKYKYNKNIKLKKIYII